MTGFHEALMELGVPMASEEAIGVADELTEFLAYHAISGSTRLARERGTTGATRDRSGRGASFPRTSSRCSKPNATVRYRSSTKNASTGRRFENT